MMFTQEQITIPAQIPEAIKWVVTAIIVPFLGYLAKKIADIDAKIVSVETKVDTANTTLVGQDGKNGLRSRVIRMESKVENLGLALAARNIQVRATEGEKEDA